MNPYEQQIFNDQKRLRKYSQAYGIFLGYLRILNATLEKDSPTQKNLDKFLNDMDENVWNQIQDDSVDNIKL
jgi:hypothetical protein